MQNAEFNYSLTVEVYMEENIISKKTFNFAIRIVKLYKHLTSKKELIMSKQLLRCDTSIGANVSEA